ncbi:MAG TPA: STAS domain-containing protein [Candidatus Sulfotelmatobacter sp.]|nr:STAS domain-containing protein [Candidatus Sulfotelmatobacter sp.]
MPITPIVQSIEEANVSSQLHEAEKKMSSTDGELVLDCSTIRRVDASALHAMERFAHVAEDKGVKVVLRGVNVEIYKVLKLTKLSSRFSFTN